jgi:3-oxoacyl-[acyl-carrier protein] reductase
VVQKKKTVFITGASRGIGKAIAQRFEAEGFALIAPLRTELDLSSVDSVRSYLEMHRDLDVDVLINNAGQNPINHLENISFTDWQSTLMVNLTSAFLLTQAFVPTMVKKGWGRVVNVSSCYGVFSRSGRAAYTASKSGLNGFTKTIAIEYGCKNVLVNAVCPGFVETDLTRQNNTPEQIKMLCAQTLLNRLAKPSEIAEFIYFLGSEKNTFITGQSILIDGGFSCQ